MPSLQFKGKSFVRNHPLTVRSHELTSVKSKATGKLVKAYKKDGKQFGQMEYVIELPMTKLEGMFPCKEGSKMEMKIVVDGCIDGTIDADSSTFTTKVTGSAEVIQDDKPTGVIIKFDISGDEKSTSSPTKK